MAGGGGTATPLTDPAATQATGQATGQTDFNQFAQNAQAVMDSAPWADHQTVTTVAQGAPSPAKAVQSAQSIGDVLRQTWDGFVQSYDDPILTQQPGVQLAASQFIHETFGPPPVAAGSLQQVQQSIQKAGYATNLPADGAWTNQWQQTYNQVLNDAYQQKAAGKRPGAVTVSSVLHNVGHLFTPSGIGDTLIGWGESARQAVGDIVGAAAGTAADAATGFGLFGSGHGQQVFNSVSQHTVNALGGDTTAAQQAHIHGNPLNIAGDVLSLTGLSSVGRALGKQVIKQVVKGAAESAVEGAGAGGVEAVNALSGMTDAQALAHAQRVGGALDMLAKTGIGSFVDRSIAKIGADYARGVLPSDAAELSRGPGVIARTLFNAKSAAGVNSGRLLGSRFLVNNPISGRLAPTVGKIAGADGWYYKARTLGAQVYKYPLARAAGDAYSSAVTATIGAHAAALALPGTTFAQDIRHTKVLDALDANLASYGPRFFGVPLLDPNNIGMFLHGPLGGADSAASTASDVVRSAHERIIDLLGPKGFHAAVQQALADGNKIPTREDLVNSVGGDPFMLEQFHRNLALQVAHDAYIEQQLGKPFHTLSAAEVKQAQTLEDSFYKTPGVAEKALAEALDGDHDVQWATNRLQAMFLARAEQADKPGNLNAGFAGTFQDWHDVTKMGQEAAQAGDLAHFVSPKTMAAYNDAVEGAKISSAHPAPMTPDSATLKTITPDEPGMYGLAREAYKSRQNVAADAAAFEKRLVAAGSNEAEYTKVFNDMRDYLFTHASRDARSLDVFAPTADKLLEQIRAWGATRAAEVWLNPHDAPATAVDRFQKVKDAGWKWVVGSHIGHVIDGSQPDVGQLDGWTSPARRFFQRAGLNPGRVRDSDVARATQLSIQQKLIDGRRNDPSIKWGPQVTASTLMGLVMHDQSIPDLHLPWYQSAILGGARHIGVNKSIIQLGVQQGKTEAQAAADLEHQLAYQQSVRDIPVKKLVGALEQPRTVTVTNRDGSTSEWNYPGMDHGSAVKTAHLFNEGYKLPTYIMGWSAIENAARAASGFGDKVIARAPNSNLLQRVAYWPSDVVNRYVHARNALRYVINPKFDAQRWVKVSGKMTLEGVDPVPNPLAELMRTNGADEAQRIYMRITGHDDTEALDTDKYALSHSLWGFFNPVWHAAYMMKSLADMGKTDAEIKAAYFRVFKYGSQGGRTALERSMNTVFFPFSFEKTVMRNYGAYLLDHPGQALLLANAAEAWRQADKNAVIGDWVRAHAPALTQLNQLNTFSRGLSLGQLGGINANVIDPIASTVAKDAQAHANSPSDLLWNLFAPQSWGPQWTKKNLDSYLPLKKEFEQLWQTTTDEAHIGWNAAANALDPLTHDQPRSIVAPSQQLGIALQAKANMVAQAQATIDYNNAQSSDADKVLWPYQKGLPADIQGKPVDKTTIGLYIQYLYPGYNPAKAASDAQAKARQAEAFIRNVAKTDPQTAADMTAFNTAATSLLGKINSDTYDHATLAQTQEQFAESAKQMAEHDPRWLTFYNNYWQKVIGPITDWTGKGTQ